jgi:hypothetical protein
MNNMQLALAWVTDPKAAAKEIEQKPTFWFPLLAVCVITAIVAYIFYSVVDFDWFIDITLRSSARGKLMTDEQLAQASQFMSRGTLKWGSVIGTFFIVPIIQLITALYFLIAGKVTKLTRTYKQWFSLTCWTSLPQVLASLPAVFTLMTASSKQLDGGAMSPLSLNELFFHLKMGEPGYALLTNINLLHFVTLFLIVYAVKVWSGRSWLYSSVLGLLPTVLVAAIAAVIVLR